jgi:hypothetical protein
LLAYHGKIDDLARPCRRPGVKEFPVNDELIVRVGQGRVAAVDDRANRAVALYGSSLEIWKLCDGRRSVANVVNAVADRFPEASDQVEGDVKSALARFRELGLIELAAAASPERPDVKFVVGIEDRVEFHWQTAIFLESLAGKLPAGWSVEVVVCNGHAPLSNELAHILECYGQRHLTGTNYSVSDSFGFAHPGHTYGPLNRVEALSAIAGEIGDDELVCLLDTDIFLYRALDVDVIPKSNALAKSWHIEKEIFFSSVEEGRGVDLRKLLESLGCPHDYRGGGVNVFITGKVLKQEKFIQDCFRFTQVLYLLGRIVGLDNVWMSEMPCFGLALTANGVGYELLDVKQLDVSDGGEEAIPPGTFFHYYSDPADPGGEGGFKDSKWHKQAYRRVNLLKTDFEQHRAEATTGHERFFFQLATKAQERLYGPSTQAH